jgi:hypothetical protein
LQQANLKTQIEQFQLLLKIFSPPARPALRRASLSKSQNQNTMPLMLTCKITALAPVGVGFVTDFLNEDGTPFIYYPVYKNIVQPDKVGMTLIVESAEKHTIERVV